MPIEDGGRDAGEEEGESKQDQENCMRRQRQMHRVRGLRRLKGPGGRAVAEAGH